jgi:hypothetical protein
MHPKYKNILARIATSIALISHPLLILILGWSLMLHERWRANGGKVLKEWPITKKQCTKPIGTFLHGTRIVTICTLDLSTCMWVQGMPGGLEHDEFVGLTTVEDKIRLDNDLSTALCWPSSSFSFQIPKARCPCCRAAPCFHLFCYLLNERPSKQLRR